MTDLKKYIGFILPLLLLLPAFSARGAETPAQFLQRCVAKINSAKSLKAQFTVSASGKSFNGQLTQSGKKFKVSAPGAATWYNGKDIWSYSRANGEVTVWTPTPSELAETNPLLYIGTSKDYNVALDPKSPSGTRILILTPKRRGASVKSIRLTVNSSTLLPKAISVKASGGNCDVKIKSITLNPKVSASEFNFNKKNYPGVNVTDLR